MALYDADIARLDGTPLDLHELQDKAVLIVNVASKCGLTPQYEGLERLQGRFGDAGFTVLGVPCNQFMGQEPGSAEEIQTFCKTTYDVTFPVFAKIDVNGSEASPLYRYLRAEAPKGEASPATVEFLQRIDGIRPAEEPDDVRWNFTKFLIGRDGTVIKRYEPPVPPAEIQADLENYL